MRLRFGRSRAFVVTLAITVVVITVSVAVVVRVMSRSTGPTEREYGVPDTLCGLDVSRDLYGPLFPPGSQLDIEASFEEDHALVTLDLCSIEVDDRLAIWSQTAGSDGIADYIAGIPNYIYSEPIEQDYEMADGTPVEGEFEAMVWPGLAVIGTSCRPDPGAITQSFTISLGTMYPEDDEESVRLLSQLIQPYMRAALERSPCEPGPNPYSDYSTSNTSRES